LLGNGDGTFQHLRSFPAGTFPYFVVVADVNGDGKPDIVTRTVYSRTVSVLLGIGDGTFQPEQHIPVGSARDGLAVADRNCDCAPCTGTPGIKSVTVLLGNGTGSFAATAPVNAIAACNAPYLADLTGDGIADSVVPDRSGNILFRRGLPGGTDTFAPPVILN